MPHSLLLSTATVNTKSVKCTLGANTSQRANQTETYVALENGTARVHTNTLRVSSRTLSTALSAHPSATEFGAEEVTLSLSCRELEAWAWHTPSNGASGDTYRIPLVKLLLLLLC